MMLAVLGIGTKTLAWENLLQDPGFEAYKLDRRGFYTPSPRARWSEITMGRGSVQLDINDWDAPPEMLAERPLGFTPGTVGYEGDAPEQNTGRIILQQDIVGGRLTDSGGKLYEAWIWLGGSGRDDDNGPDKKDERGGWDIWFYGSDDPNKWNEADAIEHHKMAKDFWGPAGSFVQINGYGKVPPGTKGARMMVWAATWGQAGSAAERREFNTEVAVDNAHFALIEAPNMLINGDFELDDRVGEFKGWQRPAQWPFARNALKPLCVRDVFDGNFDHGQYRPFYGGWRSYGYATYLSGWIKNAFTFGQYVDYDYPDGTDLLLMFYWIQASSRGSEAQLRIVGTRVEVVVEYVDDEQRRLGSQGFWFDWPVPSGAGSVGRYDQNSGQPYCPRMLLKPPKGTSRIGVHINFVVHTPYKDGYRLMNAAVDDFLLVPLDKP